MHTEPVLLINNHKHQIMVFNFILKQRMGADDDMNCTIGQPISGMILQLRGEKVLYTSYTPTRKF
ncbi:hypothetical protein HU052_17210 [Salmonella enterica subsp. enterica serovar Typhimurium]|nr:hypothetical protein [Salmonella enterica subsp. enterica serovar Typhimurium]MBZ4725512.1 hypothetical protein [Salmonella enterica subsp. enterica serovar Typhimurium]